MSIEAGIRAVLIADTAVKAIVVARVYAGHLPQAVTYPCILLAPITEEDNVTLNSLPALKWHRLQIDVFADTYAAMQDLHDKVSAALSLKTYTPTGYAIKSITPQTGGFYRYEPEIEKHRRSRDYGIWWQKT